MSNLNLNNLKSHRDEILKAEIGALLFNLGKTHIGFWRKKGDIEYFRVDDEQFKKIYGYSLFSKYTEYYKPHSEIGQSPFEHELNKINARLKDFVFKCEVKLPNGNLDWKEFFFGDASDDDFIKKIFFRGCENINSGIDKGSPKEENKLEKLWISNAFGSFKRDVEEKYFDETRLCFFNRLHRFLEDNIFYSNPKWDEIRNWILEEVKSWYLRLLSDSRFPVNDVTLFDQAYMTASMFKAVLSGLYLNNDKDPTDNKTKVEKYIENPQSIKWSILGIQYDKLGLSEKGLKAASIKWYRDTSQKVDNEIKKIIEVHYVLGNEVYRDETGIYFVVSENITVRKDNDFYRLHENLNEIKEKIVNIFYEKFGGEVYPAIFLTEPSRGLMNLGYLIEKAKENFLKADSKKFPNIKLVEEDFKGKKYFAHPFRKYINEDDEDKKEPNTAIGICPICKVRLVFKSDLDKRNDPPICEVCHRRIHHAQVRDWVRNPNEETIWTDELQDKNGRIALVTLKFELEKWLNGDLMNSLIVNDSEFLDVVEEVKKVIAEPDNYLADFEINIKNFFRRKFDSDEIFQNFLNQITDNLNKLLENLNEIKKVNFGDITKQIRNINSKEEQRKLGRLIGKVKELLQNPEKIKSDFEPVLNDINNLVTNINTDLNSLLEKLKNGYLGNQRLEEFVKEMEDFGVKRISTLYSESLNKFNSLDKTFDSLKKIINKGIDLSATNLSLDRIDHLLNLLDTLKQQFKEFENKKKIFGESIKEFITKNLYPFKYAEAIFNYFFISFNDIKDYHNRLIFESIKGYDLWEKILDDLCGSYIVRSEDSESIAWDELSSDANALNKIAKLIAQFLLRKNPSPARLRRIWETTREFFEELESEIITIADIKSERRKRLYWENIDIADGEYQDGDILFWAENRTVYLISSIEKIENKSKFSLKKYKEKNSDIVKTLDKQNAKNHDYKPYFTILSPTPISWQFVIPAENVPTLIKKIQEKYYENFRWVYGKLSLHIGVVVQNYKKPLYVGIQALRKIRRDGVRWEYLGKKLSAKEVKARQKLAFNYQQIPEQTADCEKFYSYFEKTSGDGKYEFYLYPNKDKKWLDITQGCSDTDKFIFYPNTFDFEFLDSNARRNDIYYKEDGKRLNRWKRFRPYDISDWQYFEKFQDYFLKGNKSSSKLQKLVSLIYSKLEDWDDDESLKNFMLSAFVNVLELDESDKNRFAGVFGKNSFDELESLENNKFRQMLFVFIDMFEFWHTMLKYEGKNDR